jgi:hypothetical protein
MRSCRSRRRGQLVEALNIPAEQQQLGNFNKALQNSVLPSVSNDSRIQRYLR